MRWQAVVIAAGDCLPHIKSMNQGTSRLRVASYNIRKCVGLDRRRDPDRVLSVIGGLEADVVALQEADRRLGARPATLDRDRILAETGLTPVELSTNEVSLGWHGNAVLVRPDTEIDTILRIDLPGLEPRGAAMIEARDDGRNFRIVAVHLGLARRHRRLQLETILAGIAAREEMPTFILGDFNEWSAERGLEALQPEYTVHAPGRSFHAARPVAALDRIAIDGATGLYDAGVIETGKTRIASDHLPIWADLTLAYQPNASGRASRAM